jgi:hypothetical protein
MYNFATGQGVSIGIIISGAITLHNSWRVIYTVGSVLLGVLLLLIFFSFPETAYNRVYSESDKCDIFENKKNPYRLSLSIILGDTEKARVAKYCEENDRLEDETLSYENSTIQKLEERIRRLEATVLSSPSYSNLPSQSNKKSYWSTLSIFTGQIYTSEPLWKMFIRPFGLILLPPVLWATLVMSVLIGFAVALSSSFANDFAAAYNFTAFQSGLCFFGSFVGGFLAIPAGGPFGEAVANWFTVRNRGVREPEFRLPAIGVSLFTAPLGLLLYGYGLQNRLSFMVPVVGLGLLSFSGGQAINISLMYTLDAYSPVAGEVTIAQLAFKSIIGFGLSATTNTWIATSGLVIAMSEMAAITAFVLLLAIPMFFYGARLRKASLGWKVVGFVRWNEDRDK